MRFLIVLAVIGSVLALTSVASAQSPTLWVEVDPPRATTDEVVTLTVVVEGGNQVTPPRLPDLEGLTVIGSSSLSKITVVDGRMTSSFLFEFRLVPVRTGTITIAPIAVGVDGRELLTDPVDLEVLQGTGALVVPTPRPDFEFGSGVSPAVVGQDNHIEAGVDNPHPYLGQQITYFRRYYSALDRSGTFLMRRSDEPPSFDGFWQGGHSDEANYSESAAGRPYDVYEERVVLFPSLVGDLTIDPARIFLQDLSGGPVRELTTESVTVEVRPLPEGAPEGFDGAVGDYSIQASVDSDRLTGGDPATLTVTIAGTGNVEALPAPSVPDTDDWRIYSEDSQSRSQVMRGVLRGSKTLTYLLLPNTDGTVDIPPFEFVFFNPEIERYVTIATDPIGMEIEPGSVDLTARSGDDSGTRGERAAVATGPLQLRPVAGPVLTMGGKFEMRWWHLALVAAPALAIVGVETSRRRRIFADLVPGRKNRISPAHERSGPPVERLRGCLSDLLGPSARTWSMDRLASELGRRGVSGGLVTELIDVLEIFDATDFAPPGARPDTEDLELRVSGLLTRLEEALA